MSVIDAHDFINSGHCPSLKFAFRYNDALQKFATGSAFQALRSGGYDMNLVAPDHLSPGLFKGVLTIVFIQVQIDEGRDKIQIHSKSSLSQYGYQSQLELYESKKQQIIPG